MKKIIIILIISLSISSLQARGNDFCMDIDITTCKFSLTDGTFTSTYDYNNYVYFTNKSCEVIVYVTIINENSLDRIISFDEILGKYARITVINTSTFIDHFYQKTMVKTILEISWTFYNPQVMHNQEFFALFSVYDIQLNYDAFVIRMKVDTEPPKIYVTETEYIGLPKEIGYTVIVFTIIFAIFTTYRIIKK